MPIDRRLSYAIGLITLLAFGGSGHCQPLEPQATFMFKNGWVEFALRKGDRPVARATIQISDENGKNFGDGETGDEGQTAFPLPPGASFVVVEIKTGERTADPIRLFRTETGVEPARVLLSYGLRPCCRSIKSPGEPTVVGAPTEVPAESSDAFRSWSLLVPVFAGISVGAIVLFMVRRQFGVGPNVASRT